MRGRVIVTGGGGFVGAALCRALKRCGATPIALGRRAYPELARAGIECVQVDLASPAMPLSDVFAGADAVVHTAAFVEMWGPRERFWEGNVRATERVIEGCRAAGVRKLLFTSSPSVIASGDDLRGVDESVPYPQHYLAQYPRTKAIAEQRVLGANCAELRTIALRPHLIFGPGDTSLTKKILERARAGRLVQVGNGKNIVDFTYIDDCVDAHIAALAALDANAEACGRAYFISAGDPFPFWEWVREITALHGLPGPRQTIPGGVAYALAALLERVAIVTGREPLLTRFVVEELITDHYFNLGQAKRLLNWEPKVSVREGLKRSTGSQQELPPVRPVAA